MPNNANEPDLLRRDALSNSGTFYNVLINFKAFVLTVRRRVIREPLVRLVGRAATGNNSDHYAHIIALSDGFCPFAIITPCSL